MAPVPPVSAPAVFSSDDLTRIFSQWRLSDDKITVEVVDDEEESVGPEQ